MNDCYSVTMQGSADVERNVAREVLGRRATLIMNVAAQPEVFHGVVHSVELAEHLMATNASRVLYEIELGPRFWLLKKRRRSRVFQNQRVDQIVQNVLQNADIPTVWTLQHDLPVREYCTQYEETDEEFIRRILAEAGIMFYFLQPALPPELAQAASIIDSILGALKTIPEVGEFLGSLGLGSLTGEVMVFADEPFAYYGIGDLPEGLEGLIQAAIGRVGREITNVAGPVGGAIASAVTDLATLGLAEARTSRALRYFPDGDALVADSRDVVRSFAFRQSVVSDSATFTTFDPRRPMTQLSYTASGDGRLGGVGGLLGSVQGALPGEVAGVLGTATQLVGAGLEIAKAAGADTGEAGEILGAVDDVAGQLGMAIGHRQRLAIRESHYPFLFPNPEFAREEPRRMLNAERRDRRHGRGQSLCPMLASGRRFTLTEYPVDWVNREYVVTEVVHEGRDGRTGEGASGPVYLNTFACVPSDVPYPPPRPHRRTIQTCLTATVIAPSHDAEMETRGMGEVKVRFHWEEGAAGTCWIRTMQSWSGVGWGTQFMPRKGMEVVVGFDGGDPDRPLVLGCVYNAIHPAPFSLPEHETKSGIRTHSTPNGNGFNELSFEDREGSERIFVHAERDLDLDVEHDRTARVLHDDSLVVENEQHVRVGGLQRTHIDGGQDVVVRGHRRVEVEGPHQHVTRGDHRVSVIGAHATDVEGELTTVVSGSCNVAAGGDSMRQTRGSSVELVRSARVVRAEGGSEISSAKTQEISSDSEVILRCGGSTIRVADDCIELSSTEIKLAVDGATLSLSSDGIAEWTSGAWSATGSTATLSGPSASVSVDSAATVQGSSIQFKSGGGDDDSQESEEAQITIIELADQNGNPVGRERYRIEMRDGTVRTGHLDENGRAELRLEGAAEIMFPDLPEVTPA